MKATTPLPRVSPSPSEKGGPPFGPDGIVARPGPRGPKGPRGRRGRKGDTVRFHCLV